MGYNPDRFNRPDPRLVILYFSVLNSRVSKPIFSEQEEEEREKKKKKKKKKKHDDAARKHLHKQMRSQKIKDKYKNAVKKKKKTVKM